MALKITNNATTTLAAAISSTDTAVTVASGTGALFPSLGVGDSFQATLQDTNNNYEIVSVTARTDDAMTITRAQAGTLAIAFPVNSRFEIRVTAANLQDHIDGLDFLLL